MPRALLQQVPPAVEPIVPTNVTSTKQPAGMSWRTPGEPAFSRCAIQAPPFLAGPWSVTQVRPGQVVGSATQLGAPPGVQPKPGIMPGPVQFVPWLPPASSLNTTWT